jgi:hypothetical protein
VTSTPVEPIPVTSSVAAMTPGSVRPRLSTDGAWIVFESRGRILLARRGTGEISEIK